MTEKPVQYHEGAFPPSDLEWELLIPLLGPTAAAVARYDGVPAAVPNPAVLPSLLATAARAEAPPSSAVSADDV